MPSTLALEKDIRSQLLSAEETLLTLVSQGQDLTQFFHQWSSLKDQIDIGHSSVNQEIASLATAVSARVGYLASSFAEVEEQGAGLFSQLKSEWSRILNESHFHAVSYGNISLLSP
jgi:Mating-type protein beta 1